MTYLLSLTKGWKTVAFNILAAIAPILELTELEGIVPGEYLPYYVLVIALGNMYLRSVTTTAIGAKE
tara:strand:- start:19346 stop:19546 length:201 start_codon:yes stop_codon:yes gene_type:complete